MGGSRGVQVVSVEHARGLINCELGHGVGVLDEDIVDAILGTNAGKLADADLLVHDVLPGLQLPRVHAVAEGAPRRDPRLPLPLNGVLIVLLLSAVRVSFLNAELAEAHPLLVPDHAEVRLGVGGVDGARGRVPAAHDGAEAVVELRDVVWRDGGRGGRGRGGRAGARRRGGETAGGGGGGGEGGGEVPAEAGREGWERPWTGVGGGRPAAWEGRGLSRGWKRVDSTRWNGTDNSWFAWTGCTGGKIFGVGGVLLTLKASNNIKLLDYQFTDYAQTFHIYAFFFRVDTQERQPYSRLSFQHNYPDQIKPTSDGCYPAA
jgi:hypothetical protein